MEALSRPSRTERYGERGEMLNIKPRRGNKKAWRALPDKLFYYSSPFLSVDLDSNVDWLAAHKMEVKMVNDLPTIIACVRADLIS